MKPSILFRFAIALVIALCAAFAHADSITDPTIIIRDPPCGQGCTPVGLNFAFGTPADGTGALFFNNASGLNWFSLKLTESGVDASAITCVTDVFANCSVSTVNSLTTILLSGLNWISLESERDRIFPLCLAANRESATLGRATWISPPEPMCRNRERWLCCLPGSEQSLPGASFGIAPS